MRAVSLKAPSQGSSALASWLKTGIGVGVPHKPCIEARQDEVGPNPVGRRESGIVSHPCHQAQNRRRGEPLGGLQAPESRYDTGGSICQYLVG